MTNFNPDCTINLYVSSHGESDEKSRGKGGKLAWACSVVHYKRGRVVAASRLCAGISKADAEREAVLFGLRQTHRLLQEKVEVAANFPLKGMLPPQEEKPAGRREVGSIESKGDDLLRAWESFRLRRIGRMDAGEAELLRQEAART